MRYIIETEDSEGIIGMQISKWEKEKKLKIIEKAEPLIILKDNLEKVARALDLLRKLGYNRDVMICYLKDRTGLGKGTIDSVLYSQDDFFKKIGVIK